MTAIDAVATDPVAQIVHQIAHPYQVTSDILGPSKIDSYLKCPLAYRLKYIERVPGRRRAPAALGSAIHGVIAHAHQEGWSDRDSGDAAGMLEAIWDGLADVEGADDPDVIVSYRQARDVWLPGYLGWAAGQQTLCVETRWQCEVETEDGTVIPLQGTIDRVYEDSDGTMVVSDVKSGERAPSKDTIATHLQLSLYSLAFRQSTAGDGSEALELVHLRGFDSRGGRAAGSGLLPHQFRTSRTWEYLDAVIDHVVIPVHQQIEAGIFPAHPGSLYGCNHCDVQHSCPIGQGGECNTYGD